MDDDLDYPVIFFASLNSILHVLLMCFVGYVGARYGIITPDVEKGLTKATIKIFIPCLLVSSIGDLDLETLIKLWVLPVTFFTFVSISGLLGFIGGKLMRLQPANLRFLCASIIFNNVTSLALGLLESLSKTKAIKLLSLGENDTPSEIAKRGMSYVLLVSLWSNLLRWSLGTYLLRKEPDDESDQTQRVQDGNGEPSPHDKRNHQQSFSVVIMTPSESTPLITSAKPHSRWMNIKRSFEKIINPPLCATLLAVIIGTIPFLKSLFLGPDAPLITVSLVVENFGSISIPLTLLTLGAQLNNIPRAKSVEVSSVVYIMFSRFIIMPIIGLVIILTTRHFYMQDPMLLFVLIMLACGPPAVNCMNMTQYTGMFEEEMATVLFYSYIAAAPMITLLVTVLLSTIGKMAST